MSMLNLAKKIRAVESDCAKYALEGILLRCIIDLFKFQRLIHRKNMISIAHFAPSMSARLEMTMNYYTLIEKIFKRRKEL